MVISERSVGEDGGESKDCVINNLRLPSYVCLKHWMGQLRGVSKWPVGKNTSVCASNTVTMLSTCR